MHRISLPPFPVASREPPPAPSCCGQQGEPPPAPSCCGQRGQARAVTAVGTRAVCFLVAAGEEKELRMKMQYDVCAAEAASVFCCADEAALCAACDRR